MKWNIKFFALSCFFVVNAHAETQKSLIYFDFEKMSVSAHGMYTPPVAGKHEKDPLGAEVIARANGIEKIIKYLNESCGSIHSPSLSLQPKFETMFRSQGTEIYSDGALQVNLMASYNSIFRHKNPVEIKTDTGESIVFSIPSAIPANALTCGTPALSFANNLNQQIHLQIIPTNSKHQISANEKLVKLVFDEKRNALIVDNIQDASLLKRVNFKFEENGLTFLPVVVYSQN